MTIPLAIHNPRDPVMVPITRPLIGVWSVVAILGVSEDQVISMVEDGRIDWAFNIARPGAHRAEARIFAPSIQDWFAKRSGITPAPRTIDQVIRQILPGSGDTVPATQVQRAFCCSQALVTELIRAGCFQVIRRPEFHSGPTSSPRICRATAERFLHNRRIS